MVVGEVEELVRRDFQVEAIYSGSISFGRFKNEELCWERRSSFSRNRYLEEVEECSKRGSVTEKKAFFEAHFRKKGLQNCENGASNECEPPSAEHGSDLEAMASRDENGCAKNRNENELSSTWKGMIPMSRDGNGCSENRNENGLSSSPKGMIPVKARSIPVIGAAQSRRRIYGGGIEKMSKSVSITPSTLKPESKKALMSRNEVAKREINHSDKRAAKRDQKGPGNGNVSAMKTSSKVCPTANRLTQSSITPVSETARRKEEAETRSRKEKMKLQDECKAIHKSLVFKARPLPSFYHRDRCNSDPNKARVSTTNTRRPSPFGCKLGQQVTATGDRKTSQSI